MLVCTASINWSLTTDCNSLFSIQKQCLRKKTYFCQTPLLSVFLVVCVGGVMFIFVIWQISRWLMYKQRKMSIICNTWVAKCWVTAWNCNLILHSVGRKQMYYFASWTLKLEDGNRECLIHWKQTHNVIRKETQIALKISDWFHTGSGQKWCSNLCDICF